MAQRSREILPETAAEKAVAAMLLELVSPKPGNVSRFQDLPELGLDQFLASIASLALPFHAIARHEVDVGEGVLVAVRRMSEAQAGGNTHLGAILLLAPMAAAASGTEWSSIRSTLGDVLSEMTPDDGRYLVEAISLVHPALPLVAEYDVYGTPVEAFGEVDVLEWMSGGMTPREMENAIAREYVTGFEFTFERSHPFLRDALGCAPLEDAIAHAFLWILARQPDTLIIARHGREVAERVTSRARRIMEAGGYLTERGRRMAADLNDDLVREGINPGTSADLVTAALYLELLGGYRV